MAAAPRLVNVSASTLTDRCPAAIVSALERTPGEARRPRAPLADTEIRKENVMIRLVAMGSALLVACAWLAPR